MIEEILVIFAVAILFVAILALREIWAIADELGEIKVAMLENRKKGVVTE